MRISLFALAVLAATPVMADTPVLADSHDHDAHVAEAAGLRVLHVWTPATAAGSDALFYMEIENGSAAEAALTGAEAMGQRLDLVGFTYSASGEAWTVLPALPVPAGGEVDLAPKVLALRWATVPVDLVEGGELEIEVELGGHHLHSAVEIAAPDAATHSHAGHTH